MNRGRRRKKTSDLCVMQLRWKEIDQDEKNMDQWTVDIELLIHTPGTNDIK